MWVIFKIKISINRKDVEKERVTIQQRVGGKSVSVYVGEREDKKNQRTDAFSFSTAGFFSLIFPSPSPSFHPFSRRLTKLRTGYGCLPNDTLSKLLCMLATPPQMRLRNIAGAHAQNEQRRQRV